jgi:apolipoprotein N-acyltransferase
MAQAAYYDEGSPQQIAAFQNLREVVPAEAQRLAALTSATLGTDLVILPETAFVEMDFAENPVVLQRVGRMSRRAGAPILMGAGRKLKNPEGEEEHYNSAYVMRPDGRLDEKPYDKMRLVPFGEALPYFDLIPYFQENIVGVASFTEGRDYTLFDIPAATRSGEPAARSLKLGALICFESTFSSTAREFVKRGADVLSVITNDAWYGMSAGAAAHHNLSFLRAVENRRYILRCANTGISSIISPTGELVKTLPLGVDGVLHATVVPKTNSGTTMFTRFGNTWLAVPILLIAITAWRVRRHKNLPKI